MDLNKIYRKESPLYSYFQKMLDKLNYFGENTSLHGVNRAFSLSHIPLHKKSFWILVITASGFSASVILRSILALYSGDAVSYLMDTNYIDFETPFPAVTICQQGDTGQVKEYLAKNDLPKTLLSFYKDMSFWYLKYCRNWCNNCKMNVTCEEDFVDAVRQIRSPCTTIMTDCWFGKEHFPCCERFLPQPTEYGTCFTFNSRLNGNVTMLSRRDGPNLPSLVFTAKDEVGIRVHSPEDLVNVGMENALGKPLTLSLVTDLTVLLKADITTSDQFVTPMAPAARSCLFPHEQPDFAVHWNFSRYSYSTCMLYCRAIAQYQYCNCTHHLMPRIRNLPFCKAEEIVCLSKNKDNFASYRCKCPMGCEEVVYKLVHMFNTHHKTKGLSESLAARGTRGEIRLAELPNSMVRRVAIRHVLGLVEFHSMLNRLSVRWLQINIEYARPASRAATCFSLIHPMDIGGVAGVFFGASLLSALEIIYLFFIRRAT